MTPTNSNNEYALGGPLEFLQRIWRFNHALERMSNRMRRTIGVTAQQRLLVRCIGKFPGLTAGQLARLLHLDPGTISATLQKLEAKGLLTRRRDPRDKRRVTIGLTAQGRTLDHPGDQTVESAVEKLIVETDLEDLEAAGRVLDRLVSMLDAKMPEPTIRTRKTSAARS